MKENKMIAQEKFSTHNGYATKAQAKRARDRRYRELRRAGARCSRWNAMDSIVHAYVLDVFDYGRTYRSAGCW